MSKFCTSMEQSQKLVELGIDISTADMWYSYYGNSKYNPTIAYKGQQWFLCQIRNSSCDIPAWSLSTLMRLLPSVFEYYDTKYKIDIRKYALTSDVDIYQIAYGNYRWHDDGSCSWSDMINTGQKEELIDVAFQMLVLLKENNIKF